MPGFRYYACFMASGHEIVHNGTAFRATEQSLRLMIDGILGFVFTATADGEIEFVNQQFWNTPGGHWRN